MPGDNTPFDEAMGERSYKAHEDAAMALERGSLKLLRANSGKVALEALRVAATIEKEGLRGDFETMTRVGPDPLNIDHVDNLEGLAWGLWYAHEAQRTAQASRSAAKVSESTISASREVRARMLKVCAYHLEESEEVTELKSIREGAGYMDLASDLSRLANLYQKHKDLLKDDKRSWREDDEVQARALATAIIKELTNDDEQGWIDRALRLWALLDAAYSEVRSAARFLYRHDPAMLKRFPSLVAAAVR